MYWAGSEGLDRFHDGSLISEDLGPRLEDGIPVMTVSDLSG